MPQDDTYNGLSPDQKKHITRFRDSLQQSKDFVHPNFQKFVRFYKMFAGIPPPEIKGTFSQVMLWYPWSIIDQELPIAMRSILTNDWFNLEAEDLSLEKHAKTAQKWAKYQMEKVQRIPQTIIPTMQSGLIFGTGYRMYGHKFLSRTVKDFVETESFMGVPLGMEEREREEQKSIINGNYMNVFNVFPSPTGSQINAPDWCSETQVEYLIANFYYNEKQLENEVTAGNFDKTQVGFLVDNKCESVDPSEDFKSELLSAGEGWNQFQAPQWVKLMKSRNVTKRFRVSWYFSPEHWMAMGEDRCLLYEGPPLLKYIPVAKFAPSQQLDNFFGIGLLEPAEDLLMSITLNFNHRLDYMANTFHPTTFVPEQMIEDIGGDMGVLDPSPYNTVPYNHKSYNGPIGNFVHRDRPPEINQQTFIEEGKMENYLQEILGQDRAETLQSETATVGASLISKSAARSMLRAINMDEGGFSECIRLTLAYGEKFKNQNEIIRTGGPDMPWESIDHEAITDGYGISVNGAREMDMNEEAFRKMLTIAPQMLNNPGIRGQMELSQQLLEKAGYRNVDKILNGPEQQSLEITPDQGGMPTAAGASTVDNQVRSTYNGSRAAKNDGQQIAAGNAMI